MGSEKTESNASEGMSGLLTVQEIMKSPDLTPDEKMKRVQERQRQELQSFVNTTKVAQDAYVMFANVSIELIDKLIDGFIDMQTNHIEDVKQRLAVDRRHRKWRDGVLRILQRSPRIASSQSGPSPDQTSRNPRVSDVLTFTGVRNQEGGEDNDPDIEARQEDEIQAIIREVESLEANAPINSMRPMLMMSVGDLSLDQPDELEKTQLAELVLASDIVTPEIRAALHTLVPEDGRLFLGLSQAEDEHGNVMTEAQFRAAYMDSGAACETAMEDLVHESYYNDVYTLIRDEFLGPHVPEEVTGLDREVAYERIFQDTYHELYTHMQVLCEMASWVIRNIPITEYRHEPHGCRHYMRDAELYCPTCDDHFPCRFCHDATVDDHRFDRMAVTHMHCLWCGMKGPIGMACHHCGKDVANYYCDKCKMLDKHPCKLIYHCDKCGFCLVGTRETNVHCDVCGCCYPSPAITIVHHCSPNATQEFDKDCPVCFEDMRLHKIPPIQLPCGHAMHTSCWWSMVSADNVQCPLCKKLIIEGKERDSWEQFRADIIRSEEIDIKIHRNRLPPDQRDEFDSMFPRVVAQCLQCDHRFEATKINTGYLCPKCQTANTAMHGYASPENKG
ncbi:CHY zinc finger [Carpediemonas membranifera]|uniref:CHY zinc finger n=1 Tax=Carpediemonas membranifera TaxID=201153 RepID=A0A8J6BZ16_9EUKA|nr:CHY zinc finger [Carpediemonas membranifera]|eukprot:KAG9395091.1 CHY zinc finger [Carpediemonas membranifera]